MSEHRITRTNTLILREAMSLVVKAPPPISPNTGNCASLSSKWYDHDCPAPVKVVDTIDDNLPRSNRDLVGWTYK
jgi:hypothetical protein